MHCSVPAESPFPTLRIGQAAELLGASVDTIRRWETAGLLATRRTADGQRLLGLADVRRLLDERRRSNVDSPFVAQSARNRFTGIVGSVQRDEIVPLVEVLSGVPTGS